MIPLLSRVAVLFAASSFMPFAAQAEIFRAYLASYGNDANPCTVAAPCRLLPAAISAVANNGEIWMMDSANFNLAPVAVTKSVKIQAVPGQVGSIVAVAGTAAIVMAPGVNLYLRNLAIETNAISPGTDGIDVTTGILSVDDSVFGVSDQSSAIYVNGPALVSVRGSSFRNGLHGIYARAGATVDISGSRFVNFSQAGVLAAGEVANTTTRVSVRDSVFAGCYYGASSSANVAGSISRLVVTSSTFTGGTFGVASMANASLAASFVTLGGSSVSGAAQIGLYQFTLTGGTAVFESLGNNVVRGNNFNTGNVITTISGT
jgi:hypothetical protein